MWLPLTPPPSCHPQFFFFFMPLQFYSLFFHLNMNDTSSWTRVWGSGSKQCQVVLVLELWITIQMVYTKELEELWKLIMKMKGMMASRGKKYHLLEALKKGERVSCRSVQNNMRILLRYGISTAGYHWRSYSLSCQLVTTIAMRLKHA